MNYLELIAMMARSNSSEATKWREQQRLWQKVAKIFATGKLKTE